MTKSNDTSPALPVWPSEMAGTLNLMAHPVAGMAAAGAVSLAVAGHMFGFWMGAMAGASEASRRMLEGLPADADEVAPRPKSRSLRLVSSAGADLLPAMTVETMVAEAEKLARETADVAVATARRVVADEAGLASARPGAIARPARPDDLKLVSGVGPKLESVLNGLGIWTFGQLAALTQPEIDWLDAELGFGGRIVRDDWVGQAARLSSGSKRSRTRK